MKSNLLLLALAILAACSSQPYHAKPLDPVALASHYETRTLDADELVQFLRDRLPNAVQKWPLEEWDFASLFGAALYFSPELDLARKKWATVEAGVAIAAQRSNPVLQLPFQYGWNLQGSEKPWVIGLGIDIPIETAGKRGYRIERAKRLSDATRLRIGAAAWQIRSRLQLHLAQLHHADRKTDILRRQIETYERAAAILERRYALGAVSSAEVDLERTFAAEKRGQYQATVLQQTAARAGIAAAIGVPAQDLERRALRVEPTYLNDLPPDAQAQRNALLNRADLRAALAEYEASQTWLQLQIASRYPDISIGPGYTWDAGANRLSLGASGISLPLFHNNEGPIAQAKAAREEAAANLLAVQARAIQETEQALTEYRIAVDLRQQAAQQAELHQRRFDRVRKSFDAGQIDRLEMTTGEQALLANLLTLEEADARARVALGQLEDAMQRPLATPALQEYIDQEYRL